MQSTLDPTAQNMTIKEGVEPFFVDMNRANHSPNTQRAYMTDLSQFAALAPVSLREASTDSFRAFEHSIESLTPATRVRKQASLAGWTY